MEKRVKAVLMRGGTSKGLFFHENHLPANQNDRERMILAIYGSPDPNKRQIDGIGGGASTSSKVAIISPSAHPEYDVVYNFGQVSLDRPIVDFKGNCGNISSAVGPFAIDEGLVKAVEPITTVRIHQKNTDKLIIAEVPVKNGRFDCEGDYRIAGIPEVYSRITLRFVNPGGSLTGKLFPSGNRTDEIEISDHGRIKITIIDAANPVVLVRAEAIGLKGTEIDTLEKDEKVRERLEAIRCKAAVMIGLAASEQEATESSQAVPKIAFVSKKQTYAIPGGSEIGADDVDLVARMMSMGSLHRSYAVSGAIATAGAAMIQGTVVFDLLNEDSCSRNMLKIGHPGGVIDIGALIEKKGDSYIYKEAVVGRTARRLMEGHVILP